MFISFQLFLVIILLRPEVTDVSETGTINLLLEFCCLGVDPSGLCFVFLGESPEAALQLSFLRLQFAQLGLPDIHELAELLGSHVSLGGVALPAEAGKVSYVVADLTLAERGLSTCMVYCHLIEGQRTATNGASTTGVEIYLLPLGPALCHKPHSFGLMSMQTLKPYSSAILKMYDT